MTRYLMIALACLFLVACGDTVPDIQPSSKSYMGKVTFGPSHKGAVKTVKTTCVEIKATGMIVRMDEWMRMQPQPEVKIDSISKCGG